MDGQGGASDGHEVAAELRRRLAAAPSGRLGEAVRLIMDHAFQIVATLQPTPAELDAFVQFGLSDGVICEDRPGTTPSTLPGPFYRADAPDLPLGANLCRNGDGQPLAVTGRVTSLSGQPLAGALVEVWHANTAGRYENQDPDNQPEHNLRGRFTTDADGAFHFRTIRPGGYSLPDDGPVGQLARKLGLSLDRPAHVHFAVTAPGHRRLVTAIFDGSDPAIGRDALFAVKPDLIGTIRPDGPAFALNVSLVLDREGTQQSTSDQKG